MRLLQKLLKSSSEEDLFIKRIRSLVIGEGMLHKGNIPLMDYSIMNMPEEGVVLEIGSYGGLSTNLLLYFLKKHNKKNLMFNVDAWIYEGFQDHLFPSDNHVDGRKDISRAQYSDYMKNAFMQATQFLSSDNLPHSFQLHSQIFSQKWKTQSVETDLFNRSVKLGAPIAFAYIDGGHSEEIAAQDFQFVAEFLLPSGFILWDDTEFMMKRCSELMNSIKRDPRFKLIKRSPNFLLQKI